MKSIARIAIVGAGVAAMLGGLSLLPTGAEAKRKKVCTEASGVALGGTKREATHAAKATASASASAFFGTNRLKVKPYRVACSAKLVFIECSASTTACRW